MSTIGGIQAFFVGVMLVASATLGLGGTALADKPVTGAFVTLEKASGGMLKYSSTRAAGTFEIEDLPNGRYRMSITSPSGDRGADFQRHVEGAFNGIEVIAWGGRTKAKAEAAGGALYETGVLIPPGVWVDGAVWLNVKVTNRTVSGSFTYKD